MSGDKIISLGDHWFEYPARFWGRQDRAKAAQLRAEMGRPLNESLPAAPLHTLPPGFRLHDDSTRAPNRRREVDRLLAKWGIGRR